LGLALFGLFRGRNALALAANYHGHFWDNAGLDTLHDIGGGVLVGTITVIAVAQVGSLFSSDAWNNVTFTAGGVKNPSRNLPLSLVLGTGLVIALSIAANFVYLAVLPFDGSAAGADVFSRGIKYGAEDRVARAVT